jgi:hypothetical protein
MKTPEKIVSTLAYIILAYIAMYVAIWMHEIGHATAYNYYGCKANILDVQVPFYFGNANPYPIDMSATKLLTTYQGFIISIAGIFVNLLIGSIIYWLVLKNKALKISKWTLFFLIVFSLSHFAEAFSYLTISNIYPVSDMIGVNRFSMVVQILLFILGIAVFFVLKSIINFTSKIWRKGLLMFVIVSIISMGGLRLFFTLMR